MNANQLQLPLKTTVFTSYSSDGNVGSQLNQQPSANVYVQRYISVRTPLQNTGQIDYTFNEKSSRRFAHFLSERGALVTESRPLETFSSLPTLPLVSHSEHIGDPGLTFSNPVRIFAFALINKRLLNPWCRAEIQINSQLVLSCFFPVFDPFSREDKCRHLPYTQSGCLIHHGTHRVKCGGQLAADASSLLHSGTRSAVLVFVIAELCSETIYCDISRVALCSGELPKLNEFFQRIFPKSPFRLCLI